MSNSSGRNARILLKARPTPEQLADRVAAPLPDGLELYLDVADISGEGWLPALVERVEALDIPSGFAWVVEGPLRSLDGEFFDISRNTEANREVLRRLAAAGQALEAEAAVIHAIAFAAPDARFSNQLNAEVLQTSLPLLRFYADTCRGAGLIPTIENVPPMLRMREARVLHTPVGMAPRDLRWLAGEAGDLQVTFDVSHAGLYLNAANHEPESIPEEHRGLIGYLQESREVTTLDGCLDAIEDLLYQAHISDASGLFGEGLAYGAGDLDLDRAVQRLGRIARNLVTETIEEDPNRARMMRDAQARIQAALYECAPR